MKKISILALALFLIFAFGFQAYAEDLTGIIKGGTTTADSAQGGMMDYRDNDSTLDRTNTINDNRMGTTGVGGYNNNLRTTAAGDNNNWGWLGILGLLGLAGMFGRNRNPENR